MFGKRESADNVVPENEHNRCHFCCLQSTRISGVRFTVEKLPTFASRLK